MDLQTDHAAHYGRQLLNDLGCDISLDSASDHPALSWRKSGLLQTTNLMLPLSLTSAADGALLALKALSGRADALPENGAVLLGERARLRETVRQGRFCAGGYGRLLDGQDGRLALNLVRDEDWDLVPAWLEADVTDWDGVARAVKGRTCAELASRAAEIGLAVAQDRLPDRPTEWIMRQSYEKGEVKTAPLVVDLSGLWAGPLASSLLGMLGADVVKIESPIRADGMRFGHAGFYGLINAGKKCVALNFRNADDLAKLKTLLHAADIVITASRPRALSQLGVEAEDFMTAKAGKVWARLTAYGQSENRIGFGDDIGISAGLATVMERAHNEPCFVGDAIADPVNGLHLALAVYASYQQGGGALIDMSMCDTLRYAMGEIGQDLRTTARDWAKIAAQDEAPLYPLRNVTGAVRDLGADTDMIMSALC